MHPFLEPSLRLPDLQLICSNPSDDASGYSVLNKQNLLSPNTQNLRSKRLLKNQYTPNANLTERVCHGNQPPELKQVRKSSGDALIEAYKIQKDLGALQNAAKRALNQKNNQIAYLQSYVHKFKSPEHNRSNYYGEAVQTQSIGSIEDLVEQIQRAKSESYRIADETVFLRQEFLAQIQHRNLTLQSLRSEIRLQNQLNYGLQINKSICLSKLDKLLRANQSLKSSLYQNQRFIQALQTLNTTGNSNKISCILKAKESYHQRRNSFLFSSNTSDSAQGTVQSTVRPRFNYENQIKELVEINKKQQEQQIRQQESLKQQYQNILILAYAAYQKRIRSIHKQGNAVYLASYQPNNTQRRRNIRRNSQMVNSKPRVFFTSKFLSTVPEQKILIATSSRKNNIQHQNSSKYGKNMPSDTKQQIPARNLTEDMGLQSGQIKALSQYHFAQTSSQQSPKSKHQSTNQPTASPPKLQLALRSRARPSIVVLFPTSRKYISTPDTNSQQQRIHEKKQYDSQQEFNRVIRLTVLGVAVGAVAFWAFYNR